MPLSNRRFVSISDAHLHPWAALSRGDGAQNTRFSRTLEVLHASLVKAEELLCPWVFGGDIVQTAGYTLNEVSAELTALLELFPTVIKLAVWGNHDARGVGGRIILPQTFWATLARAVPELVVLTPKSGLVTANGLTFSGAGAQPGNLFEYASPSDVGIYHGTVAGSVGPNGFVFDYGIDPLELYKRHRVSVVGDIHHPQTKRSVDHRLILIPGSPEQHNFGDAGYHGWWTVTVPEDDTDPIAECHPSDSPMFLTVATPAEIKDDNNYYRVENVPIGTELPDNATVLAPGPTTVAHREGWQGGAGQTELALQAWLKEVTPEGDAEDYLTVGRQLLERHVPNNLSSLRLVHLVIENFCSYEKQVFRIQPGTWLVMGRGRDYPSNGAGKSTLFEAIYWLVFGRTTKGLSGDDVIRWGAEECVVNAVFQSPEGRELYVTRARGEDSHLHISDRVEGGVVHWEATSVTEMTEKLCATLGLTPELYQALGYFSQERLLLFASATDGARKDMLADLVGLSAYQEASTAAGSQLSALEVERSALDGKQEAVNAQLWREQRRLDHLMQLVKNWSDEHLNRLTRAEQELINYDATIQERRAFLIDQAKGRLGASLEVRLTRKQQELTQLEQEIESAGSSIDGKLISSADASRNYQEVNQRLTSLRVEAGRATAEHDSAFVARGKLLDRATAYRLQLEAEGVCPMCHQAVSPEQRDTCLAPWLAEIEAANAPLEKLAERATVLANQVVGLTAVANEAHGDIENMRWFETAEMSRGGMKKTLAALEEERLALEAVAATIAEKDVARERGVIVAALEAARNESDPNASALVGTQESVDSAAASMVEIDQRKADIVRSQGIYDYWRHGFSKQGLQSLLLDDVAGRFNATRAEVIPALTQGIYDVQFSTLSRTKAGEWRERTEFLITERGRPIAYEALSGGQRRRVDVGVMLTLVIAVSRWMQTQGAMGVLVLDEVFDFLDAAGAEGLTEALRSVEQVIPAIYVIAHDPQLQALFPKVILVEQDANGISRIAEADGGSRE